MINFNLLKQCRKERKMTQADVAKFINRSQQAYAFYENGTNEPDTETLKKLASLFNIDIKNLLNYNTQTESTLSKNTIVIMGRDSGRQEFEVSDDEMKLLSALIGVLKKNPQKINKF